MPDDKKWYHIGGVSDTNITPTGLPSFVNLEDEEDKEYGVTKWYNFGSKEDIKSLPTIDARFRDYPITEEEQRSSFWDSMPLWYKQAYNNSIGGLMHQIATGETYYDISSAPDSLTRDLVSGFLSFFASKEDIGALLAGGGIGGAAVKTLAKAGITGAVKRRTATVLTRKMAQEKGLDKAARTQAYQRAMGKIDDVIQKGGPQAFVLGTHQGLFEAASHARDDLVAGGFNADEYKDLNPLEQWGKAFGTVMSHSNPMDFLKMGTLGLVGGSAHALRWSGKLPVKLQGDATLGLISEGLAFGGAAPVLMEGRAPTFQDFVIGAGIVGAIKTPGAIAGRLKKRRARKFVDEMEGKETNIPAAAEEKYQKAVRDFDNKKISRAEFEAAKEEYRSSKKTFLREAAEEAEYGPIQKEVYEAQGMDGKAVLDLGYYQHKRIKGVSHIVDPVTGQTVVSLSNKQFRKSISKKEFSDSSNRYLEIDIMGTFERKRPGQPITYQGRQLGRSEVIKYQKMKSGTVEPVPFLDAKLVSGSFSASKGKTISIQIPGLGRWHLDEMNTNLFFKFWRGNGERLKSFEKGLPKSEKSSIMTRQRRNQIQDIKKKMDNSEDGFVPEDYSNAVRDVASRYGLQSWEKSIMKGVLPDVNKMTDSQLYYLSRHMEAQRNIRHWMKVHKRDFNSYLTDEIAGVNNQSLFSKAMGAAKPFYRQLQSPASRKSLRLLQVVNERTMFRASERLGQLGVLTREGDKSPFWSGYIRGSKKDLQKYGITAHQEFIQMSKFIAKKRKEKPGLDKGSYEQMYIDDIIRRKNKAKEGNVTKEGETFEHLQKREIFLKAIRPFLDEMYRDAKKAGVPVERYLEGYFPRMFKKDVLDIMFNTMKSWDEKLSQIVGDYGLTLDSTNYNASQLNALNNRVKELLRGFKDEKGNWKNATEEQRIMKAVWQAAEGELETKIAAGGGPGPRAFDVWALIQMNNYTNTFKRFAPLEKQRKLGRTEVGSQDLMKAIDRADNTLMETNVRELLGEYVNGATKRIEMTKAFGHRNQYFDKLLKAIPEDAKMQGFKLPGIFGGQDLPLGARTEREALRLVMDTLTGNINFGRMPLSKTLQTVSNLEMLTKISWGYAVVPNLTQTLISTSLAYGNGLAFKSMWKLYGAKGAKEKQKFVKSTGATFLTAWDEFLVQDQFLQIGKEKMLKSQAPIKEIVWNMMKTDKGYRDGLTGITRFFSKPFSAVNEVNQMIAAATTEEFIIKAAGILTGKKGYLQNMPLIGKKRISYIENRLKRLGIDGKDVVKHADAIMNGNYNTKAEKLMRVKVKRAMQKFALDSQLQRNFMLDPYLFNDPFMKPLLLFKRFGYRQAMFAGDTIEREFSRGNPMPILTLAVNGYFGGQFVMWAKEKLDKIITGEENYYGRRNRQKILKEDTTYQDLINSARAIGSFGALSDIMVDDDHASAFKFFLKPVIIDDFQRLIRAYDTFAKSGQTHYPEQWDVPIRKGLTVAAPVLGGPVSKMLTRGAFGTAPGLETEGMEKDRVRARKREVLEFVRERIIANDIKGAERHWVNFNSVYGQRYPSLMISGNDISWAEIQKKFWRRQKQQYEEKTYIP